MEQCLNDLFEFIQSAESTRRMNAICERGNERQRRAADLVSEKAALFADLKAQDSKEEALLIQKK